MIIVYWYLFSNHYTRECIHTCERERNVAPLNSPRALYWPPPRGVGMHLMLTTLPPHPAWFPPKRGLACIASATLHHTTVGPSVCTEAGCRLTLFTPGPGPSRLSLLVITKIKPLRQCLLNCRDTYTGTQAKQGTRASTTRQGGSHGALTMLP